MPIFKFICNMIGHKGTTKFYTYSQDEMYRYTNYRQNAYCPRCGDKL